MQTTCYSEEHALPCDPTQRYRKGKRAGQCASRDVSEPKAAEERDARGQRRNGTCQKSRQNPHDRDETHLRMAGTSAHQRNMQVPMYCRFEREDARSW